MNEIVKKYDGDLTRLTTSHATRSPSRMVAAAVVRYDVGERLSLMRVSVSAWVATGCDGRRGRRGLPRRSCICRSALSDQVRRRNDRLDRVEVLAGLLVDRDRRQVRVALRVDREVAEDPVVDRDPEQRLRHLRPVPARLRDRVEHDEHRLRAVRRVRVRRRADLLAEALDEGRTGTLQRLRRRTGDADVRAVGDRPVRTRIAEAVRHLELDLRIDGADVLHQLRAVVAGDPAEEHDVRARGLDRVRKRLVAGLLRVPALEAHDLEAELRSSLAVRRGDAEAVRLLVVENEDLLLVENGRRELRVGRSLEVVGGDDARVVPLPRRVVLVRLARIPLLRQSGIRVRRADHPDGAAAGAVEDRDDDLRAAGVERPDDADHGLVARVETPVGGALGGVPTGGLRSRVVTGLVADLVLAGLPAAILERPQDRARDLQRLMADRPLQG